MYIKLYINIINYFSEEHARAVFRIRLQRSPTSPSHALSLSRALSLSKSADKSGKDLLKIVMSCLMPPSTHFVILFDECRGFTADIK